MLKLCIQAQNLLNRVLRKEEGASMVEYAIMAALIGVLCFLIVQTIGLDAKRVFGVLDTRLGDVK